MNATVKRAGKYQKLLSAAGLAVFLLLHSLTASAQMGAGPAPPATAQNDKFPSLNWTASASTGVTYNIYRGIAAGGQKGRINVTPVTVTAYRDVSAAFSAQNFYTVTAQRTSDGVESVQSNEVSATAVQGSPAPPSGLNIVLAVLKTVGKAIFAVISFLPRHIFG